MVGIGAVDDVLERDEQRVTAEATYRDGVIAQIVGKLSPEASNLLGFILDMSYAEATIVTCDAWKRKCGGLPQNSFVTIRLNPKAAMLSGNDRPKPSLILARVTEGVATPVSKEVQQTIFEIHKIQAVVDPYTNAELQWGALKATILGTYWDGDGDGEVRFGADIDSYVSAHFYEVFVPEPGDLELLINSFVDKAKAVQLGRLRYTETETTTPRGQVAVRVSPKDFVANRTALFGKTRSGKSNTIKQIADMMLRSGENVGQIIFDIGGEYAYPNSQDGTSIYSLHADRCLRYSLNPEAHKALATMTSRDRSR